MTRRFRFLVLLVLATPLAAQEILPERGSWTPPPGASYRWSREVDRTDSQFIEVDGQAVHESTDHLGFAFSAHVHIDEETPTDRRITFVRAVLRNQAGEETDLGLADRTIRSGSGSPDRTIRFEDGARPTEDQQRFFAAALEPELDLRPLLPDRSVSPGERWQTPLSQMLVLFGLDWDEFSGKGFLASTRFEAIEQSGPEPIARFRSDILDPPDRMDGQDLLDSKLVIRCEFNLGTGPESRRRSFEGHLSFESLAVRDADEMEIVTETKTKFRLSESIGPIPR